MRLTNTFGLVGIVPCIALGITAAISAWNAGPNLVADGSYLLSRAAIFVASQFTPPPVPVVAGSSRLQLALLLDLAATLTVLTLFALAFWARTHPERSRSSMRDNALLVAQLMLALAGELDLAYFLALEAAVMLPRQQALKWLLAIAVTTQIVWLIPAVFGLSPERYFDPLIKHLSNGIMMFAMQFVAFGVGLLIAAERRSRITLTAANAQLHATQQLLADTVRAAERQRIARNLHDAIGHHLTALNLHLDLAQRQADAQSPAADSLSTARGLAQDLLAEVRTAVSQERQDQPVDLKRTLEAMCQGIPAPRVSLAFGENIVIESAVAAHAVFHAIQEALTNAIRHARASRIDVDVRIEGEQLVARVTDDGIGKPPLADGNGLKGIRERLGALGGSLGENTPSRGGFQLCIALPHRNAR
jgi:two-component system sensor histidine kinase DesK